MVNRARIRKLEESVGFVHLLHVCLQGSSRYNAPKHDEFDSGKVITGAMSLRRDLVGSWMVVDFGRRSLQKGSSRHIEESSNTFSIIGATAMRVSDDALSRSPLQRRYWTGRGSGAVG